MHSANIFQSDRRPTIFQLNFHSLIRLVNFAVSSSAVIHTIQFYLFLMYQHRYSLYCTLYSHKGSSVIHKSVSTVRLVASDARFISCVFIALRVLSNIN